MDLSESQWTQGDNACFMVADSQEESQYSQFSAGRMFKKLTALNGADDKSTEKGSSASKPCPRSESSRTKSHKTSAGSQGDPENPHQPCEQPPEEGDGGNEGEGHQEEGDEEGAAGAEGGVGGAGGGGGGDPGGGGGGDDDDDEDDQDDEHEEEHQPTPPSSSNSSSGGSIPQLVRPSTSTSNRTPPRQHPGHGMQHGEVVEEMPPPPQVQALHAPEPQHEASASGSEGGGISEASTAVVSDTEGHGSVFTSRSSPRTAFQSPRTQSRSSSMSPRGKGREVSSEVSTLSSLSSSSSGEDPATALRLQRKRPAARKVYSGAKRVHLLDTSTDTSVTTTTTTSSDTSREKTEHDTSHDTSHDEGVQVGASQQDMFEEEEQDSIEETPPQRVTSTPAQTLGSLQLSQPMIVPETLDEGSASEAYIPPSQDAYGPAPIIIPASPTAGEPADTDAGAVTDATGGQGTEAEQSDVSAEPQAVPEVRRPSSRSSSSSSSLKPAGSLQQWQPSFDTFEGDRPSSSSPYPGRSASAQAQSTSPVVLESSPDRTSSPVVIATTGGSSDEEKAKSDKPRSSRPESRSPSQSMHLQFSGTPQEYTAEFELPEEEEDVVVVSGEPARSTQPHAPGEQSSKSSPRKKESSPKPPPQAGTSVTEPQEPAESLAQKPKASSSAGKPCEGNGCGTSSSDSDVQIIEPPDEEEGRGPTVGESQQLSLHFTQTQTQGTQYTFGAGPTQEPIRVSKPKLSPISEHTPHPGHQSQTQEGEATIGESVPASESLKSPDQATLGESFRLQVPASQPSGATSVKPSQGAGDAQSEETQEQEADRSGRRRETTPPETIAAPSLTIDMIETQSQNTPGSQTQGFALNRPNISLIEQDSEQVQASTSIFKKARDAKQQQQKGTLTKQSSTSSPDSQIDPFEFSEGQELRQQSSFTGLQVRKEKALMEKKKATPTKSQQQQPKQQHQEAKEDSEVLTTKTVQKALPLSVYEEDTEPRGQTAGSGSSRIRPQATLEIEDEDTQTQDYEYSARVPVAPSQQVSGAGEHSRTARKSKPKAATPQKSSQGTQTKVSATQPGLSPRKKTPVVRSVSSTTPPASTSQGPAISLEARVTIASPRGARSIPAATPPSQEAARPSYTTPAGSRTKHHDTPLSRRTSSLALQHSRPRSQPALQTGSLPGSGTRGQQSSSQPSRPSGSYKEQVKTKTQRRERLEGVPKEMGKRAFQTFSAQATKRLQGTPSSLTPGGSFSSSSSSGGPPPPVKLPPSREQADHTSDTVDIELVEQQASQRQAASTSRAAVQTSPQVHFSPESKKSKISHDSTSGEQRVVRTTRLKMVCCHTMTIVEEMVGDITVNKNTSEAMETLSEDIQVNEEILSTPSTGRSGLTLSSGDLADISSFSSSSRQGSIKGGSTFNTPRETVSTGSSSSASRASKPPSKESSSSGKSPASLAQEPSLMQTKSLHVLPQSLDESLPCNNIPATVETRNVPEDEPMEVDQRQQQQTADNTAILFTLKSQEGAVELPDPRPSGALHKRKSTSESSILQQSEPLFTSPKTERSTSDRRSSSSTKASESLFPVPSLHRDESDIETIAIPDTDPRARAGTSRRTSLQRQDTDSQFLIPDTAPRKKAQKAVRGQKKTTAVSPKASESSPPKEPEKTRPGRAGESDEEVEGPVEQPNTSPELPVIGQVTLMPPESFTGRINPPRLCSPEETLESGTPVLAMWQDKHYYPGHIICHEKNGKYTVGFEDGDAKQVKPSKLIVCELLPVGQMVLAEREGEEEWSEVGEVYSYCSLDDTAAYMVQFEDGALQKLRRSKVSLNHKTALTLITGLKTGSVTAGDPSPSTTDSSSVSRSTKPQASDSDKGTSSSVSEELKPWSSAKSATGGGGGVRSRSKSGSRSKGQDPPAEQRSRSSPPMEPPVSQTAKASGSAARKTKKQPPASKKASPEIACSSTYEAPMPYIPCGPLPPGTSVMAKWTDKHYYPGHVVEQQPSGRHIVAFEDGDIRQVQDVDMVVCELLPLGQQVYAERTEEGAGEVATVKQHYKQGETCGYVVEFQDEDHSILRVDRDKVTLSREQAAVVVSLARALTPNPVGGAANISLENLMEGKRRRGSQTLESSPARSLTTPVSRKREKGPRPTSASGRTKQTVSGDTGPSQTSASSGKGASRSTTKGKGAKRKLSEMTPKATSTPTPKRRQQVLREADDEQEAPSPLQNLRESPPHSRRSPRKAKAQLFSSSAKGPIPSTGSRLFSGMVFLLTTANKSEEQRQLERQLLRKSQEISHIEVSTDESSMEEEEAPVAFDKNHLETQIEAGGGVILDKFDLAKVEAAKQCILISDTFQRTVKYLHVLALGLPCVSHIWVRDCCRTKTQLDYRSYMLPAGLNIERNKLVEWSSRSRVMQGLTAIIASKDDNFKKDCSSILQTAGCELISKLPRPGSDSDKDLSLDFAIGDVSIPPSLKHRLDQKRVDILSLEWIIQCLICGRIASFDGHPKYSYDHEEDA